MKCNYIKPPWGVFGNRFFWIKCDCYLLCAPKFPVRWLWGLVVHKLVLGRWRHWKNRRANKYLEASWGCVMDASVDTAWGASPLFHLKASPVFHQTWPCIIQWTFLPKLPNKDYVTLLKIEGVDAFKWTGVKLLRGNCNNAQLHALVNVVLLMLELNVAEGVILSPLWHDHGALRQI